MHPPPWLSDLLPSRRTTVERSHARELTLTGDAQSSFALVTCRIVDAAGLPDDVFQRAVTDAYFEIDRALGRCTARHFVRVWNFIPNIHAPAGSLTRYMVFNAGRHHAFTTLFSTVAAFDALAPTATGVGHDGRDLWIHVLAAEVPGKNVHNPRQRSPHRYSARYGPIPPCFARATMVPDKANGRMLLLIGGTASVTGEDSRHVDDVRAQVRESMLNLDTILKHAHEQHSGDCGRQQLQRALPTPRHLRMYYANPGELDAIKSELRQHVSCVEEVEFLRAEICRPELAVEIEAIAQWDTTDA